MHFVLFLESILCMVSISEEIEACNLNKPLLLVPEWPHWLKSKRSTSNNKKIQYYFAYFVHLEFQKFKPIFLRMHIFLVATFFLKLWLSV